MEKEFVTYKQSLVLKELVFDEPCFGYYNGQNLQLNSGLLLNELDLNADNINAPTYSQAFRFFREKYGLCNFINFSGDGFCSGWEDLGNNEHGFENFKTYEEAESACLDKLIEIVKNK